MSVYSDATQRATALCARFTLVGPPTLGMQIDPVFAQASDESKADTKDGLVVLITVD